jgi:subtilisin family serine protease
MRFMFGQALAGAARRGSQRLQELETRAQTITDRATERFLNQHEKWQTQYDADKRAYTEAYQKLKGYDFLTDAQREMILLGGPEGAKKFEEALKNDRTNQAYNYSKAQTKMTSMEAGRFTPVEKPKFEYTNEMRDAFLGKVFQRSDDYNKLVGQGDEKGLADLGLGIKKASALYAQGLNPYRDIEESMALTTKTAEQENASLMGLTIPASYIQSGIRDQLSNLGIVKPEEISDAELGVGTGWKTPIYDLVDTETLMRIQESTLGQEKTSLTMQSLRQEMEFNKQYNPLLMKIKLKEYEGMDEEQKRVKLQNDNLEIMNAYKRVVNDPTVATTILEMEMEAQSLSNQLTRKNIDETSLNQAITNAHAREIELKQRLMSATGDEERQTLAGQISQVQGVLRQHLIMREQINSVDAGISNLVPMLNLKEEFVSNAKIKRGYFEESLGEAMTFQDILGGQSQTNKRKGFYTGRGTILQVVDGKINPEYQAIVDQIEADAEFKFLNMFATTDESGNFVSKLPNDMGITNLLSTFKVKNLNEYKDSVKKRITDEEYNTLVEALTDNVMPLQDIIKQLAEENGLHTDEATSFVTNLNSQINPPVVEEEQDQTGATTTATSSAQKTVLPSEQKTIKDKILAEPEVAKEKTMKIKVDSVLKMLQTPVVGSLATTGSATRKGNVSLEGIKKQLLDTDADPETIARRLSGSSMAVLGTNIPLDVARRVVQEINEDVMGGQ